MEHSDSGAGVGGYALLILLMFMTILLITLTRALPDIYTAAQREREEELIFRGNQYARAIALFHQQFKRYPASVDELLKRTNGFRFLRQAFPDPMTPKGKWRFIHISAAGVVLDSKTVSSLSPSLNQTGAGSSGPAAIFPSAEFPLGGAPNASPSAAPAAASPNEETPSFPNPSQNQIGTESSGPAAFFPSAGSFPGGAPNLTPSTAPAAASPNKELKGAFIVGVASTKPGQSIRIWKGHDHYPEWEFLGLPQAAAGVTAPPSANPGGTSTTPLNPSTPASNPSSAPM